MSKTYMTSEGIAKLEEKLEFLRTVRRQEVAARIKSAISLGDLSENSEYEDAKNEQAFLEGEISTLENTLRNVEVIEDNASATAADVVVLGTKVTLLDEGNNTSKAYTIVGSNEADVFKGRISNESPMGSACLGRHEGDIVEFTTPGGVRRLKIVALERA